MKNLQLRSGKQIDQLIARILLILVTIGFFGSAAYSQITATIPASRCGEGTLVLSATATTGTIKWYDVPFYGTPVFIGASFTTPSLAVTKTYYVDAVDGANCSLNSGSARVQVIATISANSIQASIFYTSDTFCKSVSGEQLVTLTGTAGGTFTVSPTGLSLNASTGAITPSASTNGIYTVTYTVTAAEGCSDNPALTTVTITNVPLISSISYSGSPFCTTLTSATVTLTNPNSGTYSASPSGLSINSTSGTINPSLSLPGPYTITYLVPGAGGCYPQTTTARVTITGLPTAVITYTGTSFCKDIATAQTPGLTGTGAYTGGAFSATGITINPSTGAITPDISNAGTYTIFYIAPASGNCATVQVSASLTINPLPTASIVGTTTVCQNAAEPNITFTGITGTAPFTFTYTPGAGGNQTVTTTSGSSVTIAQPTVSAGLYLYTLVSVADANGCTQTASGTATITVTGTPVADFSYVGSPFCKTGNISPTFAPGGTAGTFSATGVTFVSITTGEINLTGTPAGTYTITNTISTCGTPVIATSDITINALPTATISGTTACGSSTLTATTNATAPSYIWYINDVVIADQIASTLLASTDGAYTVKVTDGSTNCTFTSTAHTVTLIALPTASITGTLTTCNAPTTMTAVSDASSPTYIWYKNDEIISDQTAPTLVVSVAMGTGDYKVKIRNGSTTCENTSVAYFVTIGLIDDPGTVGDGQTVCTGANTTSLTLTGTKSSVLRWESSINGTDWTPIDNTTTAYIAAGLTQTTQFRAAVQNGICPIAYSDAATVTVVPDPAISSQPAPATSECIDGTAQLSVTAVDGTPSLTYQWFTNAANNNTTGTLIPGATASTYTPPTVSAGTVYYYVIVNASGNGCGTATSNVAAVTTVATSPTWTGYNFTPTALCFGGTVTFSVSITGGTGGTITWIRSETSGGAGTTVTTGEAPPAGTWYYRPHYTPTSSGCTLADGTQTTVTVNLLPTITTPGTLADVTTSLSEQSTTLAYTVTTNTPVSYSIDWTTLTDQTTTTITFQSGAGSVTGIIIPAGTAAGVYTGIMTITTANGCTATQAVSVSIAPPAPTGSAAQSFCSN